MLFSKSGYPYFSYHPFFGPSKTSLPLSLHISFSPLQFLSYLIHLFSPQPVKSNAVPLTSSPIPYYPRAANPPSRPSWAPPSGKRIFISLSSLIRSSLQWPPNQFLQMVLFKFFKHDYGACIMGMGTHMCGDQGQAGEVSSLLHPYHRSWDLTRVWSASVFPTEQLSGPHRCLSVLLAWALWGTRNLPSPLCTPGASSALALSSLFLFNPPSQKQSPGKRKGISSHWRGAIAGRGMCARNTCMYVYEMP